MPIISYNRTPKILRGAVVQLVPTSTGVDQNIVPFQYNPASVKRGLKPWNPLEVDQNQRGLPAPNAQPFDPEESISMDVELDAADLMEDDDPLANRVGIADRIAALEKMLFAVDDPLGQLLTAANTVTGGPPQPPKRKTVPVTLLVWGPGRIVPVRITSYSIEEQLFLPTLYPIQAKVSIAFQVLTPDVFKCLTGPTVRTAIAAYSLFRAQQDLLAKLQIARNLDGLRVIVSS
jgi:hypothetical protein